MSTQSVGNGANPYYEGLHDAEDEQDMRNRLALVRERDTLRAQLAAAESRAERRRAALQYIIDDLDIRSQWKAGDQKGVVDIGHGAYMQGKAALAEGEAGG